MTKEKIIEKIWLEDRETAINFMKHKLFKTPVEDLEDIFTDSLDVLLNKYLKTERVKNQEDGRKVLYGIIKIYIKKYKAKKADETWQQSYGDRFDPGQSFDEFVTVNRSSVALNPPSYYYNKELQKKWWNKKGKQWSREYYYKNHEKMLAKEKIPVRRAQHARDKMKTYYEIKKDPIKWRQYLDKYNSRRNDRRKLKKTWNIQRQKIYRK